MSEIPEAIRTLDLLEQNYNLIQSHLDKSKSLRTELTNSLILRV
jgi:hypothetical protein